MIRKLFFYLRLPFQLPKKWISSTFLSINAFIPSVSLFPSEFRHILWAIRQDFSRLLSSKLVRARFLSLFHWLNGEKEWRPRLKTSLLLHKLLIYYFWYRQDKITDCNINKYSRSTCPLASPYGFFCHFHPLHMFFSHHTCVLFWRLQII